jgi:hypothetical protein
LKAGGLNGFRFMTGALALGLVWFSSQEELGVDAQEELSIFLIVNLQKTDRKQNQDYK